MFRLIQFLRPYARYFLITWLLIIITVSSIPSIPTLKIHTAKSEIRLDYLIHFCEYGLLAGMAFLAFVSSEFKMTNKRFFLITSCLILFAVLDEYHQKLIPGRAFNLKDIYSNIAGILAALVFCVVVFRMISRRNP
ncbi:MAG: VanZ family protein [Bacteroidales bacterium]|nr:VanZ family protein [Bacteroidales bacterium]